jgi:polar amino acid transport system ATP-binding protein
VTVLSEQHSPQQLQQPKLTLQSVTKRFDDITVCDQIDLQIDTGEMLCLIGASGSGKSTLLRCLNLLEPIDDGRIWLDDTEISVPGLDPGPVRKRVGIVFQSFNLFPHMTVMDNITLAPKRVLSQDQSHAEDHAQQLLAQFGLGDKAREYPDRLSGGQQQRVAIVRALAMNPEVMLLDEITSALDPELVGEVLDVVRALKSQGMTIVLATHEMSFARDVADRVCFLDQGRVVEIAPPAVMFTNPVQQRTQQFLQRVLQQ